jgi:hemoglobin
MTIKKDIENRADVELLINSFYEKVKLDNLIGFFFNDVAKVNWTTHLPVMYNFWENIIFGTPVYQGNPFSPHVALHEKSPMEAKHFEQWQKLFLATVEELFSGPNAELTMQRAMSIATVMQFKIAGYNK